MAKVYSRDFISHQFEVGPEGQEHIVLIHGTNKHSLELLKEEPYLNTIADQDWLEIQAKYNSEVNPRCPHLFGSPRTPAKIYEAKNEKEAAARSKDVGNIIADKYVVSKDSEMEQSKSRRAPH